VLYASVKTAKTSDELEAATPRKPLHETLRVRL